MIHYRPEELEANVDAINKARDYAHAVHLQMQESIRACEGEPVYKVDGSWRKAVRALVPLEEHMGLDPKRVTFIARENKHSLTVEVRVCELWGQHFACYQETTIYLGKVEDRILTEVYPVEPITRHYDATCIRNAHKEIERLEKEISKLKSAIAPF